MNSIYPATLAQASTRSSLLSCLPFFQAGANMLLGQSIGAAAIRSGILPLAALSHLPPQTPVPTTPLQPGTTVAVKTRSIRIGSLKTASKDPVLFNLQGISFVLACK